MTTQNKPSVSVIIPSYNYGHLISDSIQSLIDQSINSWECIIIDDGSIDNTHEVVKMFQKDSRIVYYYQENKGLSAARNKGLELAKGEYIQLLDADDIIENKKLELQSQYLNSHSEIDLVFTDSLFFENKKNRIEYSNCPYQDMDLDYEHMIKVGFKDFLLEKNLIPPCAPLFRKEIIKSTGGFDESLTSIEDWDFWIKISINKFKWAYSKAKNTKALVRQTGVSMRSNIFKMSYNEIIVRLRYQSYLSKELKQKNNQAIQSFIKSALMSKKNCSKLERQEAIYSLNKIYKDRRFGILVFLQKNLPHSVFSRLIWCLFENKLSALKNKYFTTFLSNII